MRLYHFTSEKYGLLALEQRRLKIARIDELNDPFELLGWNLRDKDVRAKLRRWKRDRNAEFGMLCFSRKWSHPLLWGHYADKHKGMAIGFDVPDDDSYSPVDYHPKRFPISLNSPFGESDLKRLLMSKFTAWRYETEYRCFLRLSGRTPEGGLYFEPFSDRLKVAEVIIGDRCGISRTRLAEALGPDHAHVKSFKARPAFGSFTVVQNRNKDLWT